MAPPSCQLCHQHSKTTKLEGNNAVKLFGMTEEWLRQAPRSILSDLKKIAKEGIMACQVCADRCKNPAFGCGPNIQHALTPRGKWGQRAQRDRLTINKINKEFQRRIDILKLQKEFEKN